VVTPPPFDADEFNAFEAAGWDKVAYGYDTFLGPVTSRVVDELLDDAEVHEGVRILDVATGPGYVAARAATRGAFVLGLDVATEMVALAARLHPAIEFRRGDAQHLPFHDGSFEAVVANFVLPHLGRPERAASECARVLRPSGHVALSTWDVPERSRLVGVLVDAVEQAGVAPIADIPAGPPFFRFADDGQLTNLLRDAGFEDMEVRTLAFTHRVNDPDAFWSGLLDAIVRVRALVLAQSAETRMRIRAAFDGLVREYTTPQGLEMPVSVKIASAKR
jgi:SAM-dependent methyltransferase